MNGHKAQGDQNPGKFQHTPLQLWKPQREVAYVKIKTQFTRPKTDKNSYKKVSENPKRRLKFYFADT